MPMEGAEVHEHGTSGVGAVGYVEAAGGSVGERVDELGVNGAEEGVSSIDRRLQAHHASDIGGGRAQMWSAWPRKEHCLATPWLWQGHPRSDVAGIAIRHLRRCGGF